MMKIRPLVLTAILLALSASLYAVSFSIGVEAMYDYSLVGTKTVFANTEEQGYHGPEVTIPVEVEITDWFSVDTGVRYIMKNSRYIHTYSNGSLNITDDYLKLRHFIEFPLTVRFSYNLDRLRIFLGGGGYAGYFIAMINSGTMYTAMTYSDTEPYVSSAVDISSGYNRFDAGLIAECGVGYGFDIGTLYLAIRYQYSLTSLTAAHRNGVRLYLDTLSAGIGFLYSF